MDVLRFVEGGPVVAGPISKGKALAPDERRKGDQ
jgi:hypothetical protein